MLGVFGGEGLALGGLAGAWLGSSWDAAEARLGVMTDHRICESFENSRCRMRKRELGLGQDLAGT